MNPNQSQEILAALDPDQRRSALQAPLPRRHLGVGILILLWTLRVYVLLAVPLVVYTFVRALTR
jgi:hypothetical protein